MIVTIKLIVVKTKKHIIRTFNVFQRPNVLSWCIGYSCVVVNVTGISILVKSIRISNMTNTTKMCSMITKKHTYTHKNGTKKKTWTNEQTNNPKKCASNANRSIWTNNDTVSCTKTTFNATFLQLKYWTNEKQKTIHKTHTHWIENPIECCIQKTPNANRYTYPHTICDLKTKTQKLLVLLLQKKN